MCAPDTARTAKRDELDSQSSGPSDKLIKTERRDPTFLLSREQGTPAIVSRVHIPMLAINVSRNSEKMKDELRQEITYENYITLTDSGLDWNKTCFVHWSWSLQRELLVLVPHLCYTQRTGRRGRTKWNFLSFFRFVSFVISERLFFSLFVPRLLNVFFHSESSRRFRAQFSVEKHNGAPRDVDTSLSLLLLFLLPPLPPPLFLLYSIS